MHVGHFNKCSLFLDACFTLNSDKGVSWFDSMPKVTSPLEAHGRSGEVQKACARDAREGLSHVCAMHMSDVGAMEVSLGVGECTTHCVRIKEFIYVGHALTRVHFYLHACCNRR